MFQIHGRRLKEYLHQRSRIPVQNDLFAQRRGENILSHPCKMADILQAIHLLTLQSRRREFMGSQAASNTPVSSQLIYEAREGSKDLTLVLSGLT